MKAAIPVVLCLSILTGSLEGSPYLLSSERLVQQTQGSMKDFHSFVFIPLGTDNREIVTHFLYQELERIGTLIKKPVFTPEGADLECFSNPALTFTLVQLVDQNNKPLPILKATLSVNSTAEIQRNKELDSLSISHWCTYIEKNNNLEKIVKKTFPFLLTKFIAEYRAVNGAAKKPTFYIPYPEPVKK